MDDRELLDMAAKSVGIQVEWRNNPDESGCLCPAQVIDGVFQCWWMPADDDGDALRLVMELRLDVLQDERSVSIRRWCQASCESIYILDEQITERRSISTRRAIVRAAAEIGCKML